MLNDIRLHLDANEKRQHQHETMLAQRISALKNKNIAAFSKYVPAIADVINKLPDRRLSLFVDKNQHANLVDINTGQTFYPFGVDQHIAIQAQSWAINSALLNLSTTSVNAKLPNAKLPNAEPKSPCPLSFLNNFEQSKHYANQLEATVLKGTIDTLAVFGLGKGEHLMLLVKDLGPKYLIIYEPDWEVFRVSLLLFDWAEFLDYLYAENVQIFLQFGPQESTVFDDVTELNQQLGAEKIVFFEHEKTALSTQVLKNIRAQNWGPSIAEISPKLLSHDHNSHPLRNFTSLSFKNWQAAKSDDGFFTKNMKSLKAFFPDIHKAFENYQSQHWDVIKEQQSGAINLYNRLHGSVYSSDNPLDEGQQLAEHFALHPNLDGLVYGHQGDKLKHYLHNTFIRQADKTISSLSSDKGDLPDDVKVLLIFGLGQGYMFESLFNNRNIQNLVICEPNLDFFYASLFAIDWSPVFERVENNECKLYINLGEASSRLFKDLMSQFLVLGPHLLNETYLMQGYDNPRLRKVLHEVRIQLKVIFSMGENFDHVLYGIAHTRQSLQMHTPMLRHQPSQYLSKANKQLPVFIVGNGPSLDQSITAIKEYRDSIIVVSCGTALQSLYRNGITPDFHGEVEQNRANFDWISRINDFDYLKQITLLSVNGMHPDTIKLFKRTLLAFKLGESSTAATLAMLPENSFEELENAYPTVSNMALSMFLTLGFEQIYLIGIDLGFADQNKHHSEASGYYENGKQIFDYQTSHNTQLRVKGNKQDWVYTKTEFSIARMIIEQVLQCHHADCFNLSNGAFIEGTSPLDAEQILITATAIDKQSVMDAIDTCYMSLSSDIGQMFDKSYNSNKLDKQLQALIQSSEANVKTKQEINKLIEEQREHLLESKRQGGSLFFYYLFNSINYFCAALSKVNMQSDEIIAVNAATELIKNWQQFLYDLHEIIPHQASIIDVSEAFSDKRERCLLPSYKDINYLCFNTDLQKIINDYLLSLPSSKIIQSNVLSPDEAMYSVIDIGEQKDMEQARTLVNTYRQQQVAHSHIQASLPIGIVFHNGALMLHAKQNHYFDDCCLIYMSPLRTKDNLQSHEHAGTSDFLFVEDYVHQLQARCQDIEKFAEIIVKPRFSKAGLKNANANNIKDELISSPNEYDSLSVSSIEQNMCSLITHDSYYVYKHYLATSRDKQSEVTTLDSLMNRGLLINRKPLSFEMLGVWYELEP